MAELQLIYTTWPDAEAAETAASALLDARLIACANIFPAGQSLYRWEGSVRSEAETVMVLKTRAALVAELRNRVAALHPYDTPCILALGVTGANQAFADWVVAETAL